MPEMTDQWLVDQSLKAFDQNNPTMYGHPLTPTPSIPTVILGGSSPLYPYAIKVVDDKITIYLPAKGCLQDAVPVYSITGAASIAGQSGWYTIPNISASSTIYAIITPHVTKIDTYTIKITTDTSSVEGDINAVIANVVVIKKVKTIVQHQVGPVTIPGEGVGVVVDPPIYPFTVKYLTDKFVIYLPSPNGCIQDPAYDYDIKGLGDVADRPNWYTVPTTSERTLYAIVTIPEYDENYILKIDTNPSSAERDINAVIAHITPPGRNDAKIIQYQIGPLAIPCERFPKGFQCVKTVDIDETTKPALLFQVVQRWDVNGQVFTEKRENIAELVPLSWDLFDLSYWVGR